MCRACGRPTKWMEISRNMPKHMQMLFEPMDANVKIIGNVNKFQTNQDNIVQKGFADAFEQQKAKYTECNKAAHILYQRCQYLTSLFKFHHTIYETVKAHEL